MKLASIFKHSEVIVSLLVFCLISLYPLSYFLCNYAKPDFINSNDGPNSAYLTFYYPLRYMNAQKPDYHEATDNGSKPIKAKIDWINEGNGYTHFIWQGQEYRAATSYDTRKVSEGDEVNLYFDYSIETWEDFSHRLRPRIVNVSK